VYELVDTCGVYELVDVIYMCYLLLHVILSYIYMCVCVCVCLSMWKEKNIKWPLCLELLAVTLGNSGKSQLGCFQLCRA
jgi:uncharacterized membrane protein YozB (DUF420 family)